MDNQECTIQRHIQHWVQDSDRRQTIARNDGYFAHLHI